MLFTVFADLFPKSFQDHVSRLEADTQYRTDFQAEVANMPLDIWENTPKWKLTAKFRKLTHPACERCGRTQALEVHHKHYRHKGIEVLHPEDLEVVCDVCHRGIHQLELWPSPMRQRLAFPQ
jgi:5-methylcytosine-specific restriction endonuclease McrA